jgi:hypothetical protein
MPARVPRPPTSVPVIGYVPRAHGHYIENIGQEDLHVVAVFKTPEYQEVDLSNWLSHTPPALVAQHLNMDIATVPKFQTTRLGIQPPVVQERVEDSRHRACRSRQHARSRSISASVL